MFTLILDLPASCTLENKGYYLQWWSHEEHLTSWNSSIPKKIVNKNIYFYENVIHTRKKKLFFGEPKNHSHDIAAKNTFIFKWIKKKSLYETSGTISMCQDLNRDVLVKECDTKPKNTYTH